MLDIKFIRQNPDVVKKAINDKQLVGTVNIDELLEVDQNYRDLLRQTETKRSLRNQLSKDIAKVSSGARQELLEEATQVKQDLSNLEKELKTMEDKLQPLLHLVPNIIHPDVPYGESEDDNTVARTWGEPTKFAFTPKDHVTLGRNLDLIDTETSAVVSGSRLNYLKNEAVLLQFAVVQFTLEALTDKAVVGELAKKVGNPSDKPFVPIVPPVLVKADVAKKMDRLDPIDDRYFFEKDNILLVGSAEHTLGPMHMDQVIDEKDLPIRYLGYSTAFRREAGSYGKDTKGILRQHQFDKLEMESFSKPEYGLVEQELLVAIQEYLVQQLKIPYQIVNICTEDMGKPDYRQLDVECWLPGQNKYRETHTSDYMTDFQARRLNIKYKSGGDVHDFVHMNDATAFAIGRLLIAILENYQQKDGSVRVPDVLQPYMHGITEIKR